MNARCADAGLVSALRSYAPLVVVNSQRLRLPTQVVLLAPEPRLTRRYRTRCNACFAYAVAPLPCGLQVGRRAAGGGIAGRTNLVWWLRIIVGAV